MSKILEKLFDNFQSAPALFTLFFTLLIGLALLLIGIVGVIPFVDGTGSFITLNLEKQIPIGAIGLAILLVVAYILVFISRSDHISHNAVAKEKALEKSSKEYQEQFVKAQKEIEATRENILPAPQLLAERAVNRSQIAVINGNILEARTEAIVSSDDNHFRALGGVAKAIVTTAGESVGQQLNHYGQYKPPLRQGSIVVTTGGKTVARIIIHPAVIDIDFNRFPDQEVIKRVIQRILICAEIMGVKSIAIPVIGGGTGSKHLETWDIIQILLSEVFTHLSNNAQLEHIELYVWGPDDKMTRNIQTFLSDLKS